MIFREANLNDIPVLIELEQHLIDSERPYNGTLKSKGGYYYNLPDLVGNDDSHLLVVEAGSNIIGTGYAQIRVSKHSLEHDKHAYIGFLFVSPNYRGKGKNRQVLDRLIDWSQTKGIKDFYLDVYSQNEAAIKAYRKAGFEPSLMEMKLHK